MRSEVFAEKKDRAKYYSTHTKGHGGPVIDMIDGKPISLDNESNVMFLGVTGSGKSRRGTINAVFSFIDNKESFVITDPKGEIRDYTWWYAKDRGYTIKTVNFRDIAHSPGFNILAFPYELYTSDDDNLKVKGSELLNEIAEAIYPHAPDTDPFWIDSARSLFVAACLILFEHGRTDQINIPNVINVIRSGRERIGSRTAFDELHNRFPDKHYNMLLNNIKSAPNDTYGSILSSVFEPLNEFTKAEALEKMLCTSDFRINSIDPEKPTAIYLVIPDENNIYGGLAGIIVSQLMNNYVKLAHEQPERTLPRRVNLVLEELGNIGKSIPNLPFLMSAGRSRNIRTMLVLQSLAQLDDIYKKSKATTILSNCDTLIVYRISHYPTLEEFSVRCGERTIDYGSRVVTGRLITATQLGAMETGQALVMISGRIKYIVELPDFTEINDLSDMRLPGEEPYTRPDKLPFTDIKSLIHQESRLDIEGLNPFRNNTKDDMTDREVRLAKKKYPGRPIYIVAVDDYQGKGSTDLILSIANGMRDTNVPRTYRNTFFVCTDKEKEANDLAGYFKDLGARAKIMVSPTLDTDDDDLPFDV